MKQLLSILLFLLPLELLAQSAPSGYTTNFGLRKYAQGANPGADSLNANWTAIDFLSGWTRSGAGLNLWTSQTQPKVHIRTLAGDTTGTRLLNVYGDAWSSGNWFSNVVSGSLSPGFAGQRALTGPAAVTSGTKILSLLGQGYNGTSYVTGGEIAYKATETFSGSARGTEIEFYTTPNASTTNTLALTLGQDQSANFEAEVGVGGTLSVTGATTLSANVGIGTAPSATSRLRIVGGAAGTEANFGIYEAGGSAVMQTGASMFFDIDDDDNSTDAAFVFRKNGTGVEVARIDESGNLTVTGATTLAAMSATTGTFSGLVTGNAGFKDGSILFSEGVIATRGRVQPTSSSAMLFEIMPNTTTVGQLDIYHTDRAADGTNYGGYNILTNATNGLTFQRFHAGSVSLPAAFRFSGNLSITGDALINGNNLGSTGNLTIDPVGDLLFNPTGNDVYPTSNYDLNLGLLTNKFLTLHAAELWVETLVAQNTLATIGGRILTGPTTPLILDVTTTADTINVKYNNLDSGDVVYLESDSKVEFLYINSPATAITGGYSYDILRDRDQSGANLWYAGDAVFSTGAAGDGFIDQYSVRGVSDASEIGPTIVGNVREDTVYNNWNERWAIGNLNGLFTGYSTDTYGAAFGDPDKNWSSFDATNGIRFSEASTVRAQWLNDSLVLGSRATENIHLSPTTLSFRDGTETTLLSISGGTIQVGVFGFGVNINSSGQVRLQNKIVEYDGVGTSLMGVPIIVTTQSETGKSTSVAFGTGLGTNTLSTGIYRVTVILTCDAAPGETDQVYAQVRFEDAGAGSEDFQTPTLTLAEVGDAISESFTYEHQGGGTTEIDYSTTYTSGGGGTDTYAYRIIVERLN